MPAPTDQLEPGQYIPLHYHYNMLNDTARMSGFESAIAQVVRPGSEVLELGGGTGVLSCLAAKRGAHVRCVEPNPEVVATARHILSLNGYSERVDVIEADADRYLPPIPVFRRGEPASPRRGQTEHRQVAGGSEFGRSPLDTFIAVETSRVGDRAGHHAGIEVREGGHVLVGRIRGAQRTLAGPCQRRSGRG